MKIAILTDSSCGIKDKSIIDNLNIVPLMITKKNGEQIKDDDNLSTEEFYTLIDSQYLKTTQTVPGLMIEKWKELLKDYDQIICLFISKGLSGQYNTFKMLSKEEEYLNKIFVIDTDAVSILLKRQIEVVDRLIKDGKNGQEILEIIEKYYNKFEGYIIPKSLKSLVMGGRISKAAASLAKILKITPILRYDGCIDKQEKTRTFKKAIERSIELIALNYPNSKKVDISFSRAQETTINLVKNVINEAGFEICLFEELPNVVTCHTGRETFAIMPYQIWEEDQWK